MSNKKYSGYICAAERKARRYALVTLVILQPIVCIFFIKAFKTSEKGLVLALLVGWIVLTVLLIVSYYNLRIVESLEYSLEENKISNSWAENNKIELDLHDSYFCTVYVCSFGYIKSIVDKSFYLFSTQPFDYDSIKGEALGALKNINKNNIIILPKTDTVESWINENLEIFNIPEYPSIGYKPSRNR